MGEVIFVVLMLGGMIGTAVYAQQVWLAWTFGIFFICFGIMEGISVSKTKKTISQHFWALSKTDKKKAWVVIIGMLVAWLALLWHFAYKHLI